MARFLGMNVWLSLCVLIYWLLSLLNLHSIEMMDYAVCSSSTALRFDPLFRDLPVAPWSGNRYGVFVVVGSRRDSTLITHLCSMRFSGLNARAIVYVCLDYGTFRTVSKWGFRAHLISDGSLTECESYYVKINLASKAVESGIDCFIIDSDVLFFDNFYQLWDLASPHFDFEISTDERYAVASSNFSRKLMVNSGVIHFRPSLGSRIFLAAVQKLVTNYTRCVLFDQDLYRKFTDKAVPVNSVYRRITVLNVTFKIIEPFIMPNGCISFCYKRPEFCRELERVGRRYPVALHLNYHWTREDKEETLRIYNWERTDNPGTCVKPPWTLCSSPENDQRCYHHVVKANLTSVRS